MSTRRRVDRRKGSAQRKPSGPFDALVADLEAGRDWNRDPRSGQRLLKAIYNVHALLAAGKAEEAVKAAVVVGSLIEERYIKGCEPTWLHGNRMKGRKKGSYGEIKKQMIKIMRRKPLRNPDLVTALADAGCAIYEDRRQIEGGTFIEGPRGECMTYKRFLDAASEVRSGLKANK